MSVTCSAADCLRIALAFLALSGVLLQFWLYMLLAREHGKPDSAAWISLTAYFTIFTNLYVAIICSLPSLGVGGRTFGWLNGPTVKGCAVTATLLVAIAYHFLLREVWNPQGMQWVVDIILHYVVPAGALVYWILPPHPVRLSWTQPIRWCSYPFIYLGYAMVRGEILDSYPYPFIDVNAIGYMRAILNAMALIFGFLILGTLVLWISRLRHPAARASITE